jgi:hypothetical protein
MFLFEGDVVGEKMVPQVIMNTELAWPGMIYTIGERVQT